MVQGTALKMFMLSSNHEGSSALEKFQYVCSTPAWVTDTHLLVDVHGSIVGKRFLRCQPATSIVARTWAWLQMYCMHCEDTVVEHANIFTAWLQ